MLAILISGYVSSQARLGYTYDEVRKEFWLDHEYSVGYDANLGKYIDVEFGLSDVRYYFDEDNICYCMASVPKTKADLHYLIELYNNTYVIVDDTHWKWYSNGVTSKIDLVVAKDGTYFFLFH